MDIRACDEHICREIWTKNDLVQNHRHLCLAFRGRFSGSVDAAEAAKFIESTLNQYRCHNISREWFRMTFWKRGTATFALSSPTTIDYPCLALPYAPSCDTTLELYDCGMGQEEDIVNAGGNLAGKAVMVDDRNPEGSPRRHRMQKYLDLREAGAAAFIFVSDQSGMLAPTGSLAFNQTAGPEQVIPAIGIALETASELREFLRRGPVKIRLKMENELLPGRDCNVIGDLLPSEPPPALETIIVSAHYDGHDIAQGANDNASGTAVVMEIARLLAPVSDFFRRRVRFVLFGAEEVGLVGSHSYVDQHREELSGVTFVLNLDCVGDNGPLRFDLQQAVPSLEKRFRKHVEDLASDLIVSSRVIPFSDHFPFALKGIPGAFTATSSSGKGRGWGHTIADTFEKVSPDTLRRVAMYCARLIARCAADEAWPHQHRSVTDVLTTLQPLKIEKLFRYEGHWPCQKC